MVLTLLAILALAAVVCLPFIEPWILRRRERIQLEHCSILPEQLYTMMKAGQRVLIFDIRQPPYYPESEMIPGSRRVPPRELVANPEVVPRNKDAVLYCTCPGDETSLQALHRARNMGFLRVKFLKGGLAAWKACGLPVETYDRSFWLDAAS